MKMDVNSAHPRESNVTVRVHQTPEQGQPLLGAGTQIAGGNMLVTPDAQHPKPGQEQRLSAMGHGAGQDVVLFSQDAPTLPCGLGDPLVMGLIVVVTVDQRSVSGPVTKPHP